MTSKFNYKHTISAGYLSFITQAIVNNFTPLLFVTFQKDWNISLGQLAVLSTYNFVVQLITDILSARYVDRIGVRRCIVFAHISAATGVAGLGIFPYILNNHYAGIMIAITLYALGGGLIEVLTSPIIEACPTENKEAHMSLLHSFYCWGQVATILISTAYFSVFGVENWRIMALLWAILPAMNGVYFALVPIPITQEESHGKQKIGDLFKNKLFYMLILMMLCAGASELAMSQWASAFTEETLGISKTAGDIAGPCFFALLMGIARSFYAKFSKKIPLEKYMFFCAALCFAGYLTVSLPKSPVLSLIGCGICGFAVGIMWPGTYSIAAKNQKSTSTALFAMLALAGDCGCSTGPFLVGTVSEKFGDNLKAGLFAGSIFPFIMIIAVFFLMLYVRENNAQGKIKNTQL